MSRQIRDPEEYKNGSKWFMDWHRIEEHEDASAAIDLDVVGYCKKCNHPIYLIEATRGIGFKTATVTEHLAKLVGATVWVVHQDKNGNHPGQIFVDDRTLGHDRLRQWFDEHIVWAMLQTIRASHDQEAHPR